MIEQTGNLFDTDAAYIGHGVNCKGAMGAGIAKQFRDKFERNYEVYKTKCETGELQPGGFLVVPERLPSGRLALITNLASQNDLGPDARYSWLMQSLWTWAEQASQPNRLRLYGGILAVPEIGCGIGGLEWPRVKRIMEAVEDCFDDIEFEVWHYEG